MHGRGRTLYDLIVGVEVRHAIIFVEEVKILDELNVWREAYTCVLKFLEVLASDAACPHCPLAVLWHDVLLPEVGRGRKEGAEDWTLDKFALGHDLTEKVFSVTAPHLVEDQKYRDLCRFLRVLPALTIQHITEVLCDVLLI